jgi:hypothetical protein
MFSKMFSLKLVSPLILIFYNKIKISQNRLKSQMQINFSKVFPSNLNLTKNTLKIHLQSICSSNKRINFQNIFIKILMKKLNQIFLISLKFSFFQKKYRNLIIPIHLRKNIHKNSNKLLNRKESFRKFKKNQLINM